MIYYWLFVLIMIPTERRVEQCTTCMAEPSSLLKTGVVGAALKLMLNSLVLLMLLLLLLLLLLLRVSVFDRYINLSALFLLLFLLMFLLLNVLYLGQKYQYIYLVVVVVVELLEVELLAFAALCSSPSTARPRCPAVGLDLFWTEWWKH